MRHYLSIAAIFRDEAPYLREFIEFHRLVGVEHFYLYDNGSVDGADEILAPYVAAGVVSLRRWPGEASQLLCYLDAALRYRDESHWIAFIDVDEFLFSPLIRPLPESLRAYEAYPGVAVNWCVFGTSGVEDGGDGLVIETFTRRTRDEGLNRHVKTIVNPRRIVPRAPGDPHHWTYTPNGHARWAVNELKHPVYGAFSDPVSFQLFRVNHYWSKSIADAARKASRRRADTGELRSLEQMLDPALNEELDRSIAPYLPQLRSAVAGIS